MNVMENTWKVVEMRNRSDRNRKGDCEPAEASRISEGRKGLRRINNKECRLIFGMIDRTALRDLTTLCEKGIFEKVGITGRKTEYVISRHKPDSQIGRMMREAFGMCLGGTDFEVKNYCDPLLRQYCYTDGRCARRIRQSRAGIMEYLDRLRRL